MKLKQILIINGIRMVNTNSGDVLAQLALAQEFGHIQLGLDPHWLQGRTNFLELLGRLFIYGRCHIYDMQDQISADIRWEWVSGVLATIPDPHCLHCGLELPATGEACESIPPEAFKPDRDALDAENDNIHETTFTYGDPDA